MTLGPSSNGHVTLSEAIRAQVRALAERYPSRRTALLPALKLAQTEVGYLPPAIVAQVADLVGVPHAAAAELVAFYTMLHAEPAGATRVVVCAQLPCALQGAHRLLRELSAGLGIQPGDTTPDGAITLERTSECFGACHRAPMARVNDEYWEQLDPPATERLIGKLAVRQARSPGLVGASAADGGPGGRAPDDRSERPRHAHQSLVYGPRQRLPEREP